MKQLRVLTGRHAGVQLTLSTSKYRIAADEQADIQLVDWQAEPLNLELLEEGNLVTITTPLQADAATGNAAPESFVDFEPRRFGDVVLCVGPALAAWPSDVELLERLMRPVTQAAEALRQTRPANMARAATVFAAVAALAVGGAFASVVWRNKQAAQEQVLPEPLAGQVLRTVAATSLKGVTVRPAGDHVVVEGLLADGTDALTLRQLLTRFPAELIEHKYAAAPDIAQSISDALGTPGLTVSFRGRGVFEVGGRAMYLDKVRSAANRIAADLAPLVRGIEVVAVEAPAPDSVPVGALLTTDGLQYVQTRDGAKHLSLLPEPIAALSDAPAPSR
ncbi:MAG TPA: HrpD5 family protein [Roseateles sp.]